MTTTTVEETALATSTTSSGELAPTASAAAAQFEIQSAVVLARQFPRNEDAAFAKLMRACARTSFAEDAEYSFPRGGQTISGPSVNLARESARIWGNIRYGLEIVRDDPENRQIRGWAWDLETNTKVAAEDEFRKLVQRKKKEGRGSEWVTPDERDLRELTNRRGAILVRNCILQLLPSDLIEDAVNQTRETLKAEASRDPESARKRVILAFASLNVDPEMLGAYLGKPVGQCSPEEIAKLRTIYQSIKDGNSNWQEYAGGTNGGGKPAVGMPTAKAAASAATPPPAEGAAPSPDGATPPPPPADAAPAAPVDAAAPPPAAANGTAAPQSREPGSDDEPEPSRLRLIPPEPWAAVMAKWHRKGAITKDQVKKLITIGTTAGYSPAEVRAEVQAGCGVALEEISTGAPFDLICGLFSTARPTP